MEGRERVFNTTTSYIRDGRVCPLSSSLTSVLEFPRSQSQWGRSSFRDLESRGQIWYPGEVFVSCFGPRSVST